MALFGRLAGAKKAANISKLLALGWGIWRNKNREECDREEKKGQKITVQRPDFFTCKILNKIKELCE
jgi:hypothetical protein